jgi:hypothetical protein
MQHPVADFPQAHDVPLIAQQEQAEGQVAVIVHGRQSGKPAYLLTQPRQLRLSDVPAVEHIQRSVERSCREPPVSGVQIRCAVAMIDSTASRCLWSTSSQPRTETYMPMTSNLRLTGNPPGVLIYPKQGVRGIAITPAVVVVQLLNRPQSVRSLRRTRGRS